MIFIDFNSVSWQKKLYTLRRCHYYLWEGALFICDGCSLRRYKKLFPQNFDFLPTIPPPLMMTP